MGRLLILGAGIAGQTAALHAKNKLGSSHEVTVVSPNSQWNWIPSNIWIGTGYMKPEQVTFPLAPVYDKTGITFHQAKAVSIHPEGDSTLAQPFVTVCPILPDFEKYPDNAREMGYTSGEIGLAGHWIKHLLHYPFIYKAKANPFWRIVPE